MKITILGGGNLGQALAKGFVQIPDVKKVIVTRRSWESNKEFNAPKIERSEDNIKALEKADVILLAVQPGQLEGLLDQIKNAIPKNSIVISVVSAKHISFIEEIITGKVPIVRAMPNTAVARGASMTCLSMNDSAKPMTATIEKLFKAVGETLFIEEDLMQAATVIGASGIAFWMRLIRATTQGAIQLGFEAEEAQKLATFTCLGASKLLSEQKGAHPESEIDKVTTPKGCTIAGLNEMEYQGLSSALIQGILKSYHKISEL